MLSLYTSPEAGRELASAASAFLAFCSLRDYGA